MIGFVWTISGLSMIGVAALFVYSALAFIAYWVLLFLSATSTHNELRRASKIDWEYESKNMELPGVTLIVPAYNEETTVVNMVQSALNLHYPNLQVVVVNDGSTDGTLDILERMFELAPANLVKPKPLYTKPVYGAYRSAFDGRLVVIDKENGGKADALNCGINFSEYELFCAVDADSVLEPDALTKLVYPFRMTPNTIAAGGNVRILNGGKVDSNGRVKSRLPKSSIEIMQIVEYIRNMMVRMAFMKMNALSIISGAIGLFKKDIVVGVGGYQLGIVGEDMELVLRLHRHMLDRKKPYNIVYVPDAVCWTEAPSTLSILNKQRNRWQRGLLECMFLHKRMLFRPKYKLIGMMSLPYIFITGAFSPFMEAAGFLSTLAVLITHFSKWPTATWGFIFATGLSFFMTIVTISIDTESVGIYLRTKQLLMLSFYALIENCWYQPLMIWPRITGTIDYFRCRAGWGKMTRTGYADQNNETEALRWTSSVMEHHGVVEYRLSNEGLYFFRTHRL